MRVRILAPCAVLETVSKTYGGLTDQVNENTNSSSFPPLHAVELFANF